MAFADRVQETTTTTGTGTITLAGAVTGYQAFGTAFPASSTAGVPYTITDAAGNWETGIGTYNLSANQLSRGVQESSNANNLVSFGAGSKNVFCAIITETIFTNPMTTAGDLIVGGVAGAPGRVGIGLPGQVATVDPTGLTIIYANASGGLTRGQLAAYVGIPLTL